MVKVSDKEFPLEAPAGFLFEPRPVTGTVVNRRIVDISDWIECTNDAIKLHDFKEQLTESGYEAFLLRDSANGGMLVMFDRFEVFHHDIRVLRPIVQVIETMILGVQISRDFLEQRHKRLEDAVVSACFAAITRNGDPDNIAIPARLFAAMKSEVREAYDRAVKEDLECGR